MTLGDAIFQKLIAAANVKKLVENRIYPVTSPDKPAGDYIVFQVIGGDPLSSHTEPAERSLTLVQFSCWSDDYEAAVAIREALIEALDNQTMANGDIAQLEDGDRDDFDQAVQRYRCDADFLF